MLSALISNNLQLLQKTKSIFPPTVFDSTGSSLGLTLSQGKHTFPFSVNVCPRTFLTTCISLGVNNSPGIQPPRVAECYKLSKNEKSLLTSCAEVESRKIGEIHLLRRLPPSCGDSLSAAEVKYFLQIRTMGKRIPKECRELVESPRFAHFSLKLLL
jgi:hypothetical protein